MLSSIPIQTDEKIDCNYVKKNKERGGIMLETSVSISVGSR